MCGILGITGTPYAAMDCYLGLMMLQHRGQDSAGILTFDATSNTFHSEKNMGHVKEAIKEEKLTQLSGSNAIAHNRYSTIGTKRNQEIQPMCMNYPYGIAMAHNGQISNANQLKEKMNAQYKRLLLSQNDLELIMNLFAEGLLLQNIHSINADKIFKAVEHLFRQAKGGYSVVGLIAHHGLIGFKDPNGIRPLVFGKKGGQYAFASESKTLDFLGFEEIEEVQAGEVIYIDANNQVHRKVLSLNAPRPCMFEWIYFANADSTLSNENVYSFRLKLGSLLASQIQQRNYDLVVPVPDTSRPSAIVLAEELGIPYREVLIKNRYAQRTFILNKQKDREKAVRLKLNVVQELIQNRNILLVDDSIVRGTTSKHIVKLLLDKGARSVTIASTCPPLTHPCFYGIDFPEKEQLVAHNRNSLEIAEEIGAKEVIYLTEDNLKQAFKDFSPCTACIDGAYPVLVDNQQFIHTRIKDEVSWVNQEHL